MTGANRDALQPNTINEEERERGFRRERTSSSLRGCKRRSDPRISCALIHPTESIAGNWVLSNLCIVSFLVPPWSHSISSFSQTTMFSYMLWTLSNFKGTCVFLLAQRTMK